MTDSEVQIWLEALRSYHQAISVRIVFEFEDGQSVYQEAVEE